MKLTILIPTVPSRLTFFYPKIMNELLRQTEGYDNIELIALFDNKKRTIGAKRQSMLDLVQGEYVAFIDDDDRIAPNYIQEIMDTLTNNPESDCIVFNVLCTVNGGTPMLCKYGIEFKNGEIPNGEWRGQPAHIMVYKTSIAKKHKYKDMGSGEDCDWVRRACLDIKCQIRIDKVLYYYDAEYETTSETVGLSDETIKHNINLKLNNP